VEQNLKRLGEDRIEGLILDLRDNGGRFAEPSGGRGRPLSGEGQSVVSQRGRSSRERVYTAEHATPGRRYPIVVLVNHYSAFGRGNRFRRAAGSRSGLDFRREHVRQGPGANHLSASRPHCPGLTTAHFYTPAAVSFSAITRREPVRLLTFTKAGRPPTPTTGAPPMAAGTVFGGNGIAPDEKSTLRRAATGWRLRSTASACSASHARTSPRIRPRLPEGWMAGQRLGRGNCTGDYTWLDPIGLYQSNRGGPREGVFFKKKKPPPRGPHWIWISKAFT